MTNVAQLRILVYMTEPAQKRQFEWLRGDRLYKARKDAGHYEAQAFADLIGISRGSLFNYEHDRTKPSKAAIMRWAQETHYNYKWLMDGEGDPLAGPPAPAPGLEPGTIRLLACVITPIGSIRRRFSAQRFSPVAA